MSSTKKIDKTNAMRILDSAKLAYDFYTFEVPQAISGVEVAEILNKDVKTVFKTLVTVGKSGKNYVFVIPVAEELDLKKAAIAAGEKSVAMLKSKDLLPLTGYVHGGCSPIGMKKFFPTFINASAQNFSKITFSGGKIGLQIEIDLKELSKIIKFLFVDLTV